MTLVMLTFLYEMHDHVLLLLVEGDDDQSSKLVDSFNDAAVSDLIANANCVALLLPVKRSGNLFLILLSIPVY